MAAENLEAVEKALGNPVAGDLPENALRVRRNLLVFGMISVFITLGGVKLDPTSSVLGFKFSGVSEDLITNALLAANVYFLLHFIWYAFEGILEWRLRVTGTRLAFLTGSRFGSEHADYPDDPRQSTLYTWWLDNAKRIGNFKETADDLSEKIKAWEEKVSLFQNGNDSLNLANAMSTLNQAKGATDKLTKQIETTEKVLTAMRISCSLGRFDGWFKLFLKSQNIRWLIIDILLPVSVGVTAIYLLAKV